MRQMVAAGNVMNSAAHRSGCKERITIGNIKKNKGEESKDDYKISDLPAEKRVGPRWDVIRSPRKAVDRFMRLGMG